MTSRTSPKSTGSRSTPAIRGFPVTGGRCTALRIPRIRPDRRQCREGEHWWTLGRPSRMEPCLSSVSYSRAPGWCGASQSVVLCGDLCGSHRHRPDAIRWPNRTGQLPNVTAPTVDTCALSWDVAPEPGISGRGVRWMQRYLARQDKRATGSGPGVRAAPGASAGRPDRNALLVQPAAESRSYAHV